MRVLHVIPSLSAAHGGPTEALKSMEQGLCAAGTEVTILVTDDNGPASRFERDSYPAAATGADRIYCRKWLDAYKFAPGALLWLLRHVQNFDVIHIHALFSFTSTAAAFAARLSAVPYIVRPLGTLTRYGLLKRRPLAKRLSLALLEKRILKGAAAIHFTSQAELEEAKALDIQFCSVVIPLAVDLPAAASTRDLRRDHPGLRERSVLLYLSRLDPKKNVEGLLLAFARLEPKGNALALLIAGDGEPDYTGQLKSLASSLGMRDEVIWLGRIEGEEKAAAFGAADLFVLPSLSENFGLAAAEALLAGLPCVLGRSVAIAAEVEGAGAGVTVDPDPRSIAEAIDILLRDPSLRREMGQRGRELAQSTYSRAAMVERLLNLYHAVARQELAPANS